VKKKKKNSIQITTEALLPELLEKRLPKTNS